MCFCLGMSESYLDDKCAPELLDWVRCTGMGLQYIGFIISSKVLQNAISVMMMMMMMERCLLHYQLLSMISKELKVQTMIFEYTNRT